MPCYTLGPADELAELEARGFDLEPGDEHRRCFVIRKDGRFYAYINTCPHAGAPLNWQGDRFLSFDRRYIQCALHGALFDIENGACVAGPCNGVGLQPVPVRVENGRLVVEL